MSKLLQIEKLNKSFGGVKAVNNCSFKINKREIVAIVGPNGSGKSTIFNLISRIETEDSGEIFFEGINITHHSLESVSNRGISRTFQRTQLFENITVKKNLLLAFDDNDTYFWRNLLGVSKIPKEKEQKIVKILSFLELEHCQNKLGRDLSYGQKKLVELARAILKPHKLLMLDEPVAGISPRLRPLLVRILKRLKNSGETILIIEHDLKFALAIADKVILLDKGRIIMQSAPKKIRNDLRFISVIAGV